jgi:hypothetical protein
MTGWKTGISEGIRGFRFPAGYADLSRSEIQTLMID